MGFNDCSSCYGLCAFAPGVESLGHTHLEGSSNMLLGSPRFPFVTEGHNDSVGEAYTPALMRPISKCQKDCCSIPQREAGRSVAVMGRSQAMGPAEGPFTIRSHDQRDCHPQMQDREADSRAQTDTTGRDAIAANDVRRLRMLHASTDERNSSQGIGPRIPDYVPVFSAA